MIEIKLLKASIIDEAGSKELDLSSIAIFCAIWN
jgi:hypothetical protein